MEVHRRLLAHRRPAPAWDQTDVFLITYPDQVWAEGATPLRCLSTFARSHLKGLFSGVHVLPFFPSSSDDGFAVTDYHKVDPAHGSWQEVTGLGRDFRLMVDLVLNHASAQSAWFTAFREGQPPYDAFFRVPEPSGDWSHVVRPRTTPLFTAFETRAGPKRVWTTFGPDQVDLDYRHPDVLLSMLDLIMEYVEHRAEVIRLDAIAYIGKRSGTSCLHLPEAHAIVRLLRLAARAAAPWVRLITETNVPHADGLTYFGDGDEADLVYSFALPPLIVHALTTGDAGPMTAWAAALMPPPSGAMFFHFLASHDGIGLNAAAGLLSEAQIAGLLERAERCGSVSSRSDASGGVRPYEMNVNLLDMLAGVPPEIPLPESALPRFLCAHAILLTLAGVPAIYFHSLVGSRGDVEAVRRTGRPRSINREKLERRKLEQELRRTGSLRWRTLDGMARLLRARRTLPSLDPQAPQTVFRNLAAGVFGLERTSLEGAQRLICLHEIAGGNVEVAPAVGRGRDLLTGESVRLDQVELGPYQVRWVEVVG
ncbi:MAG: alpha-amylase family glycosyl hydrolase [Anaerolineales bacterium]